MALTKEQRDALPPEDFAVPGKRKLPMQDEKHVRMGWDMVDRTEGLTPAERSEARRRLMEKAKKLGIDTSDWSKVKAMSMDVTLEAMSLDMPSDAHPNKMPFSGFLVWLDEASDKPPGGAGGRLVIMTEKAAEKAIPTLLGMGVNYADKFDGHDAQKKIGIIAEADIRSDPQNSSRRGVHISGFIYASDFPNAAARIRADKDVLGFSFEAQGIKLADPGADILEIKECVFTGAAILRKDKAAYSTTSLAAHAEGQTQDIENMTPEELAAAIATAIKPVTDGLTAVNGRLEKIEAAEKDPTKLAAANQTHLVEPHAKALEACADGMTAAGIGGHETRGHATMARKMAAHMRASAAMGELPHIFRDHDFFASANGEKKEGADSAAITAAVEAAVRPLKDEIAATGTKLEDLKTKAFNASASPERKTITPDTQALLDKFQIKAGADGKLTAAAVDAALDAAKVTDSQQRIAAKLRLQKDGLLTA